MQYLVAHEHAAFGQEQRRCRQGDEAAFIGQQRGIDLARGLALPRGAASGMARSSSKV